MKSTNLGKISPALTVCFERLKDVGYKGGISTVKNYIAAHRHLVSAKRQLVSPQGNRELIYNKSSKKERADKFLDFYYNKKTINSSIIGCVMRKQLLGVNQNCKINPQKIDFYISIVYIISKKEF